MNIMPRLTQQVEADPEAIARAADRDGVVQVRHDGMNPQDFVDLMRGLGPLMFTEGETPADEAPDLNVVTNVGRTTKPKSVFHSDTTYVARPPSYSGLIAVEVPQEGGATLFHDQYAAYDALPATMKTLLDGATVLHSVTGVTVGPDSETEARHPVVRRHPGTGRAALYFTTPARCSELTLNTGETRDDLIQWLYDFSLTLAPPKAHAWSQGDVVIWDNRCTLHAADHSRVVGNRTLYRGMVRGEVPVAAHGPDA
ncbi:MAG: TauD/TfdA family dioxygenase [Pseudomonadota bacterium]